MPDIFKTYDIAILVSFYSNANIHLDYNSIRIDEGFTHCIRCIVKDSMGPKCVSCHLTYPAATNQIHDDMKLVKHATTENCVGADQLLLF